MSDDRVNLRLLPDPVDPRPAEEHGPVGLRPATPDDVGAVASLWHVGWHDAHDGHVPEALAVSRTPSEFTERTEDRVGTSTVAVIDGEIVGFTTVTDDEVEQVFVDGAHRGTTVAAILIDDAEEQVRAAGHDVAWLAVVEGNARARRFYERHGWSDVGPLPYEVTSGGATFLSPCRRYEKPLAPRG